MLIPGGVIRVHPQPVTQHTLMRVRPLLRREEVSDPEACAALFEEHHAVRPHPAAHTPAAALQPMPVTVEITLIHETDGDVDDGLRHHPRHGGGTDVLPGCPCQGASATVGSQRR